MRLYKLVLIKISVYFIIVNYFVFMPFSLCRSKRVSTILFSYVTPLDNVIT